jgi:ribosomal-protein-alanine N-acetyltransferase
MTDKQMDLPKASAGPPPVALPEDLKGQVKFGPPTDEDMNVLATLRAGSEPWRGRGEGQAESLESLTKLRAFVSVARWNGGVVGYVTIERDGPVPGAAYLRNIVIKPELRQRGMGALVLEQGLTVARDMNRKTLALRVDPANSPAVSFYRKAGFTTVATVVSKKSGKLRLLMSREL